MVKKKSKKSYLWLVDYLTVFLVGFVSMAIEIIGMRFVSPYLGTSNLVWSIFIGVVLLSMSIGSFSGGFVADKYSNRKAMVWVLVGGLCWVSGSLLLGDKFMNLLAMNEIGHVWKSLLGIFLLFGFPFFVLSFVLPLVMRLSLKELDVTGRTFGRLQMTSSLGNILGVVISTFVFLNFFGTRASLYLMIIILAFCLMTQLFMDSKKSFVWLVFLWLIFIGALLVRDYDNKEFLDVDSLYSRIQLVKKTKDDGEYIGLMTGNRGFQGSWKLKDLSYTYAYGPLDFLLSINYHFDEETKVLVLGGGGYIIPLYLSEKYGIEVDVVEIDEKMTKVSDSLLGFLSDENINVYQDDGRVFVNSVDKKYDVLVLDVFSGDVVPFHLLTHEAFVSYESILNANGVLVGNVRIESCSNGFIGSVYKTLSSIFKDVMVFSNRSCEQMSTSSAYLLSWNEEGIENTIDVGGKYVSIGDSLNLSNAVVLKDDFFPTRFTY